MNLPSVSIIIPTLNEEHYIGKTLKSVIDQTYKGKYEIIVADGNSNDNTVNIARKYTDNIIASKKKGIARGRNAGASIATGDILLFCDADTVLMPNTVYELVKPFLKNNCVATACEIRPLSSKTGDVFLFWLISRCMMLTIKAKKAHIPGICFACSHEAFRKANGFNEQIHNIDDLDFSMRLNKIGDIVFTNKTAALTSMRRFEKLGRIKSLALYSKVYVDYHFKKENFSSKKFIPIR